MYNVFAGHPSRLKLADPLFGLSGKKTSWMPDPSRSILLHEPPATSYQTRSDHNTWYFEHWHETKSGVTEWFLEDLGKDPSRFISPIAFIDGHVARHDFSSAIRTDPNFPNEPTKDWVWYKPAEDQKLPPETGN